MSSLKHTERSACRICGGKEELTVWDSVNVTTDPELKAGVRDGSLFVWKCPRCGSLNLILRPVLYHDEENRLMVWCRQDRTALPEEAAAFGRQLEDYTLRLTATVGELIEKVAVFDTGLDDAVMELCKYVTRLELAEKAADGGKAAELMRLPFKFYRLDGADRDLILSFPQEGRMHTLRVGFNVYEDCKRILARNPELQPPPGFAEVGPEWVASRFR